MKETIAVLGSVYALPAAKEEQPKGGQRPTFCVSTQRYVNRTKMGNLASHFVCTFSTYLVTTPDRRCSTAAH